jgi:predicted Zn finger-like uncharacterized protein
VKFLCDRCRTRYSIGDDRVRGKILKIRCKNCANVITVREGMTPDPDGSSASEGAGRPKKTTTAAPGPLPDATPERAAADRNRDPIREPGRSGLPRASAQPGPGVEASPVTPPVTPPVATPMATPMATPVATPVATKDAPARNPAARSVAGREPIAKQPGGRDLAKRTTRPDDAGRGAQGAGRRSASASVGTADTERPELSSALGAAYASAIDGTGQDPRPSPALSTPSIGKPPPALEEEWYVSVDGEQAGPFSLSEAQRWVVQKPFDAELHCWSEGFDDWLSVDKVSHFRSLRKRPAPVPALPRIAGVTQRAAAPDSGMPASVAPQPGASSRSQSSSSAGASAASPASPISPVSPTSRDEPKPLFAATLAALERGAPIAGPGAPSPRTSARATPPFGTPAPPHTRSNGAALHGAPFDTSEDSDPGPGPEALRYRDARSGGDDRGHPPPSSVAASPAGSGGTGADLRGAVVTAAASDFESGAHGDDLDIGEVSRVVNLADLARGRPGGNTGPAARSTTGPLGRAPSHYPNQRATSAIASFPTPVAAGTAPDAAGESGTLAPAAKSHRRGLIALLTVAAVMVLGVAAAVVLLVTTTDDITGSDLGPVHSIDTSRPEDPITHRPIEPAPVTPVRPVGPHVQRPNPPASLNPQPGSNQLPEPVPGNPLRSDEIEDVARKHQDMTQRCYLRSQRGADSIIVGDVKKIAVTLTIDKDGSVSDLQLSEHAGDNLGKCLSGSIKSWKFRTSSGGTFRFSLNFVSG